MQHNERFWKLKLAAFLHDPPCKALGIQGHEDRAKSFRASAGIEAEDYKSVAKEGDWVASAADRFPFPKYTPLSGFKAEFDGTENKSFLHPLGGESLAFDKAIESSALAEEKFQEAIGVVPADQQWNPFAKFMLYWRRWPEESALLDQRLTFMPADTRMPDHTIWNHMSVTSAFQACVNDSGKMEPAFLMFSLGPVQDFIAAARRTRDFLGGSYLLSWLTAHAMKVVADEIGPDCVIFPNLRGQPIFDALYREEVYDKIKLKRGESGAEDTLWERMGYTADQLQTPSLPNVFLALVPAWRSAELGQKAENAVKIELANISEACWKAFEKIAKKAGHPATEDWKTRRNRQVELFPQIYWQAVPWSEKPEGDDQLNELYKLAYKLTPTPYPYKNAGFYWQRHYKEAAKWMAARKNLRDFDQFDDRKKDTHDERKKDVHREGALKDCLTGKEEIIGSEKLWDALKTRLKEDDPDNDNENSEEIFKHNEGPYGAMTIIKRLWMHNDHVTYLAERLGKFEMKLKSVPDIAKKNNDDKSPYVAVIAMDGDEMGKWISGEKLPKFLDQLAPTAKAHYDEVIKKAPEGKKFDENTKRALSPSFHLQFSEALSNFANHVARRVVEGFKGMLIYAGGDDLLAVVPADKALACAYFLRSCFRGEAPELLKDSVNLTKLADITLLRHINLYNKKNGWLEVEDEKGNKRLLLMPGPKADVSCGIAIAHEKYPLTAMIREAQDAEKRAKNDYDRGAFAVSLLKHGGETVHWGAKWQKDGFMPLKLYQRYSDLRKGEHPPVSARFPYALAELLQPYRLEAAKAWEKDFDPPKVIRADLDQVLERQVSNKEVRSELRKLCEEYLNSLGPDGDRWRQHYGDFAKLFLTSAFIHRKRGEE